MQATEASREHSCSLRFLPAAGGWIAPRAPNSLLRGDIHRDGDLGFSGGIQRCVPEQGAWAHRLYTLWTDMEMELGKCSTTTGCDAESFLLLSIPILSEMMGSLA